MGYTFSYSNSREEGNRSVAVVFDDGTILTADSDHPNFRAILGFITTGEPDHWGYVDGQAKFITEDGALRDLFDFSVAIGTKFDALSDRVSTAAGRVFFDGDEVNSTLADQIIRFHKAGVEDFKPLVNFWERIATNPEGHSRDSLYDWLNAQGNFQITDDGYLIAYKGLRSDYSSCTPAPENGGVTVEGVSVSGPVPHKVGAVIRMPRSKVNHDPSQGCSVGLHAGTYAYASGFARGALMKVKINPRDVCSVPTDCSWAKMRVCEYEVLEITDKPDTSPVYGHEYDDNYYEGDEWGDEDFEELDYDLEEIENQAARSSSDAVVEVPVGTLRTALGALRNAIRRERDNS